MNKFPKISGKGPFFELDGRKQTAVKSMVEDDLTDEQIGKLVERTDRTIRNWKNDELFIAAKEQYLKITVKNTYVPKALSRLYYLMIHAKSEMVQMQSATTILKMGGQLSDNSTPELDRAKIRKANADARVAEARAKAMEDNGADVELLLDKMMDTLAKEDLKHGSK